MKDILSMNYKSMLYLPLCMILLGIACTPKTIGTKSEEEYSEDLSRYRIDYEDSLKTLGVVSEGNNTVTSPERPNISGNIPVETEFAITDSLHNFLEKLEYMNREANSYQGVTIQVYSGLNRNQATEAKNKVYEVLSDAEPRLVYEQPNYKVRVGRYTDRMEAQKDYAALQEAFPLVLVVPEKFKVVE